MRWIAMVEFPGDTPDLGKRNSTGFDGPVQIRAAAHGGDAQGKRWGELLGESWKFPSKRKTRGESGESGIRTHGGVSPTHAFQACSLNHSDISPRRFDSTTK